MKIIEKLSNKDNFIKTQKPPQNKKKKNILSFIIQKKN